MRSSPSNSSTLRTAILFGFIANFAMTSCSRAPEPGAAAARQGGEAVTVELAPITVRSVQRGIEVTGTLFGDDEAAIPARIKGPIVATFKDLGDRVEPGELLAQIDRTEYELAREQSEAALREALSRIGLDALPTGEFDVTTLPAVQRAQAEQTNARARHERGLALFGDDPPLISEQELENLATALEVASREVTVQKLAGRALLSVARTRAADLAVAEQDLLHTEIRAPHAHAQVDQAAPRYAVAAREVSVGEFVSEGAVAFALIDDDPVKFRVDAPERFQGDVRIGQRVVVGIEAFAGEFHGAVTRIAPRIDPASRTFQIEIEIPNADARLKPGAFARGRIETHMDDDVLFAPRSAVASFAGVKRIYTVQDGKAREHRVQTGVTIDDTVEIIAHDLPEDAMIVVEGVSRLAPGAAVIVADNSPRLSVHPVASRE